ncbi:MAG TPA: 2OG-Fe(II) oxygenase [Acidimicrobiales bacterium]|nr:2OG-Fe(II) oxygenase [Acidimicrobiales bacterium]
MATPLSTGWAVGNWPRSRLLSYLPPDGDTEPAYAIADAFEPPHPLALPEEICDRLVAAAMAVRPTPGGHADYHLIELEPDDEAAILGRFAEANALWWNLELDRWDVRVQHYRPGQRFAPHQDLHAGAACRKFAGSVQLSTADDYEGGDLVMHFVHHRAAMPRTRGTLVAFPGWTVHGGCPDRC